MSRAIPLASLPADVRAKLSKRAPRGKGKKTQMTENAKRLRDLTEHARVEAFFAVLKSAKLPAPLREVQFHDARKWRFDYAWMDFKLALEVDGGAYTQGRHTRGAGFVADMDKLNAATVMGWRILRTTPDRLTSKSTEEMLRRCLR